MAGNNQRELDKASLKGWAVRSQKLSQIARGISRKSMVPSRRRRPRGGQLHQGTAQRHGALLGADVASFGGASQRINWSQRFDTLQEDVLFNFRRINLEQHEN